MVFRNESIDELYVDICRGVLTSGEVCSPRGMKTYETINNQIVLTNPKKRFLKNKARKLSFSYAIGEWLWYMSGSNELDMIEFYSKNMRRFSDDGKILAGAYGPRIMSQIEKIIAILKSDADSRRAVISVYDKSDTGKNSLDIPCTLSLQFLIRNKKLDLIVNMRANDVFLGLPYDIFSFSLLQEYVAYQLRCEMGVYYHNVSSLHIYDRNIATINQICENKNQVSTEEFYNMDYVFENIHELLRVESYIRKSGDCSGIPEYEDVAMKKIITTIQERKNETS